MSKSLTLKTLSVDLPEVSRIPVPEFGDGEDGEPMEVNVRALTIFEYNSLMRSAFTLTRGAQQQKKSGHWRNRRTRTKTKKESSEDSQDTGNGNMGFALRVDYDEQCLVAAWCTLDDDGKLVFGVDTDDAFERVKTLPYGYRPAIQRIHREALVLSRIVEEDEDGEVVELSDQEIVEIAEARLQVGLDQLKEIDELKESATFRETRLKSAMNLLRSNGMHPLPAGSCTGQCDVCDFLAKHGDED